MFCLGRRKSLLLLASLILFLLIMTFTHLLSPPVISRDDFIRDFPQDDQVKAKLCSRTVKASTMPARLVTQTFFPSNVNGLVKIWRFRFLYIVVG
jgi:hypothetical protein